MKNPSTARPSALAADLEESGSMSVQAKVNKECEEEDVIHCVICLTGTIV